MEPPRCVTTLPGAVCTITAPVSSSERKEEAGEIGSVYFTATDGRFLVIYSFICRFVANISFSYY